MSNEEFTAKQEKINEIEAAVSNGTATQEMIQEADKLRQEVSEEISERYSEDLLKRWGVPEDAPVGTTCENF